MKCSIIRDFFHTVTELEHHLTDDDDPTIEDVASFESAYHLISGQLQDLPSAYINHFHDRMTLLWNRIQKIKHQAFLNFEEGNDQKAQHRNFTRLIQLFADVQSIILTTSPTLQKFGAIVTRCDTIRQQLLLPHANATDQINRLLHRALNSFLD